MRPGYTDVTVILDRSGSMGCIKKDMEGGFDAFVAAQSPLPGTCKLSLVQFDTGAIDTVYSAVPIAEVKPLNLVPRGGTPLLDAIGQTIVKTGERLKALHEADRPERVMLLILTDGEENSSKEYSKAQVKTLIQRQQEKYQWAILYLGANVDSFHEAGSLGIYRVHTSNYTADSQGVVKAFASASGSLGSYRAGGSANF